MSLATGKEEVNVPQASQSDQCHKLHKEVGVKRHMKCENVESLDQSTCHIVCRGGDTAHEVWKFQGRHTGCKKEVDSGKV